MSVKRPKYQTDNPDTQKFCGECGTHLPSPKEKLTPGFIFAGRNQIIEELGKGGKVALKLIKSKIAADVVTLNILLFGRER